MFLPGSRFCNLWDRDRIYGISVSVIKTKSCLKYVFFFFNLLNTHTQTYTDKPEVSPSGCAKSCPATVKSNDKFFNNKFFLSYAKTAIFHGSRLLWNSCQRKELENTYCLSPGIHGTGNQVHDGSCGPSFFLNFGWKTLPSSIFYTR